MAIVLAVGILYASDSFSLNHMISIQNRMIHASGSTMKTPPPTSPSGAQPSSRGKSVRQMPRVSSGKKGGKSGDNGSGVSSYTIKGKASGQPGVPGFSTQDEDVEDLIDRLAEVQERRRIAVVADNGSTRFEAEGMFSGIDDQLRFETESGRVFVDIDSISSIVFGEKDLNMLPVTVHMVNGKAIRGNIYVKYVLEFLSEDTVIATYASQLNSVRFLDSGSQ